MVRKLLGTDPTYEPGDGGYTNYVGGGYAAGSAGGGTVTSVTAGDGMTQSGAATVNPTLDIVSAAGTPGSVGTLVVTADAVGAALGNTSTTACAGDDTRLSDARTPVGTALTSAYFWLGSAANAAAPVAMSGDATISNTGVVSVNKTRLIVRNETGSTIATTRAVIMVGFNNVPLIGLSDNTDEAKHNVIGLTVGSIAHEANGYIATGGQCDAETNAWPVGTELYWTTAGNLSATEPTSGEIKHIGIVTVQQNYPTGKVLIYNQFEGSMRGSGVGGGLMDRLGDSAGATKWSLRNYANVEVFSINSLGVIDPPISSGEPALGNPASNGYLLSSTTGGVRSWVAAGGGSDPWTYLKLAADFTTTSATAVDVTGLGFTPAASSVYQIEGMFLLRTATATVGPRPGCAWPTSASDGCGTFWTTSSATAQILTNGNIAAAILSAVGGLPNTTSSYPGYMQATLVTGAGTTGDFKIQLASETAGTTVTMKAGSFIRYRTI